MFWRKNRSVDHFPDSAPPVSAKIPAAYLQEQPVLSLDRNKIPFLASFFTHLILILVFALIPIVRMASQQIFLTSVPSSGTSSEFQLSGESLHDSDFSSDAFANANTPPSDTNLVTQPLTSIAIDIELPMTGATTASSESNIQKAVSATRARNDARSGGPQSGGSGSNMSSVGVSGIDGAVDRITYEILKSIELRPTTVIWLFDASFSLAQQRSDIERRIDRIYQEVGRATKNKINSKTEPLLTGVVAYGATVNLILNPTADVTEIQQAIHSIDHDITGTEVSFNAIALSAEQFHQAHDDHSPDRNVMFIVITDERGNDLKVLDQASDLCRAYAIKVYVLGVPAPFGRMLSVIKFIDPRPQADNTPRLAAIEQGPESFMPERLQLGYVNNFNDEPLIDSGFGSYSLSRICHDTGGIFFTIHPNRIYDRDITRKETSEYVAFIQRFFDPDIMANYMPDYLPPKEYQRRLDKSPMRSSLVEAAGMGPIPIFDQPTTQFVVGDRSELPTEFAYAFDMCLKARVRLEAVCKALNRGKLSRDLEQSPRWLAGYDLAYATANAERIRNEIYRQMLVRLKRGMKFKDDKHDVWLLTPSPDSSISSDLQAQVGEVRGVLARIVDQHKGTPWAYLANQEIARPIGWTWSETQMQWSSSGQSEMSLPTPADSDSDQPANEPDTADDTLQAASPPESGKPVELPPGFSDFKL